MYLGLSKQHTPTLSYFYLYIYIYIYTYIYIFIKPNFMNHINQIKRYRTCSIPLLDSFPPTEFTRYLLPYSRWERDLPPAHTHSTTHTTPHIHAHTHIHNHTNCQSHAHFVGTHICENQTYVQREREREIKTERKEARSGGERVKVDKVSQSILQPLSGLRPLSRTFCTTHCRQEPGTCRPTHKGMKTFYGYLPVGSTTISQYCVM